MSKYHDPVLLNPSVDGLITNSDGIYVDCTFGGGGHSRAILERLSEKGKLIAFDQDKDALENTPNDDRFSLQLQNFKYLKNQLKFIGIEKVDGVLADFGVSSHQFDVPSRGFSTRFDDAPLDMRMNQNQKKTAADILNSYEEEDLANVLYLYGELKSSRKIAREIVNKRSQKALTHTSDLKELFNYIPARRQNKFFAQLFQALRIEVNEELDALKSLLKQLPDVLKPDGRFVSIAYHSLEDRLVKRFIKFGLFEGQPEKDVFGNWHAPLKPLKNKVTIPDTEEIENNSRARSAKLRIAIRNHEG